MPGLRRPDRRGASSRLIDPIPPSPLALVPRCRGREVPRAPRAARRGGPDLEEGSEVAGRRVGGGREADPSGSLGGMGAHVVSSEVRGGGGKLRGAGVLARGQGEEGKPRSRPVPSGLRAERRLRRGIGRRSWARPPRHRGRSGARRSGDRRPARGGGSPTRPGPGSPTESASPAERRPEPAVREQDRRGEAGAPGGRRAPLRFRYPGGPAAHPGVGIGEQPRSGGRRLGQRIAGQGVGGAGVELGVGQGRPALGRAATVAASLKRKSEGKQPGPALLSEDGEEGLPTSSTGALSLPRASTARRPRLAVGIVHRGDRAAGTASGFSARRARTRPPGGRRGTRPGGGLRGRGNPCLSGIRPRATARVPPAAPAPPGERLLDEHRLVLLPVDQVEEHERAPRWADRAPGRAPGEGRWRRRSRRERTPSRTATTPNRHRGRAGCGGAFR